MTRLLKKDENFRFDLLESVDDDDAAAVNYLERLAKANPWRSDIHGRLSMFQQRSGQTRKAIESALRAVALDPSKASAYGWLSELYRMQGRAAERKKYQALFKQLQQR